MRTQTYLSLLTGVAFALGFAPAAQAGFQWTAPTQTAMPAATGTALPHVAAAPVAPVTGETLPGAPAPVSANAIPTTPDGPAAAAPIYGEGPQGPMTNDPITWNAPHSAGVTTAVAAPRAPQSVLPAETQPLYPAPAPAAQVTQTTYAPPAAAVQGTVQPVQATYTAPAPIAPVTAEPTMIASATSVTTPAGTTPTAMADTFDTAQGFGSDLPLVMAIRQIVPPSYGFVFDDGIDLSTNVSWKGGQPWNVVLANVLTPLNLRAVISGKVVSILPAVTVPVQVVAAAGPSVTTTQTTVTTSGNMMAPVATPVTAATAPAVYTGIAPVMATPVAHTFNPNASTTWTAPRNSTLRGILENWSRRAGVELYWASEYDYPVQTAVSISGTFEQAVQTLLKGLNESRPRPLGRLHPNLPNGPAVLVIETRTGSL
jgi:hypothetical protein